MVAITRAIGRKAAMEMLVTGRELPAAEALKIGLINRVVALDKLEQTTTELAEQIAQASSFALAIGKQGLYAQADMSDAQAFHYAKHTIVMNNLSEDAQNGIKAFLEKRQPEWKNR
jgi:enoyl-CoA hydratase/carnithine racemase